MSEHPPIHIALCCDDKYARHCSVTMLSVIRNTRHPERIVFALFHEDFSPETQENILRTFANDPCKITFVDLKNEYFATETFSSPWPKQVLYRFKVPKLFPGCPDKILYLDADTIVIADVAELWREKLNDCVIGAVSDLGMNTVDRDASREVLGLAEEDLYFNSGVLLIDVRKWKEQDVENTLIRYIESYGSQLEFLDQDALNHVLRNKWKPLPQKWNMDTFLFRSYYRLGARRALRVFAPKIAVSVRAPGIIHYTGYNKPWRWGCYLPKHEKYFEYLAQTPWKGYRLEENTFRNRLRRMRWRVRIKLFS